MYKEVTRQYYRKSLLIDKYSFMLLFFLRKSLCFSIELLINFFLPAILFLYWWAGKNVLLSHTIFCQREIIFYIYTSYSLSKCRNLSIWKLCNEVDLSKEVATLDDRVAVILRRRTRTLSPNNFESQSKRRQLSIRMLNQESVTRIVVEWTRTRRVITQR